MAVRPRKLEVDEQRVVEHQAAAQARRRLVDHLTDRGRIPDPAIRDALLAVPREVFLPGCPLSQAYADQAVSIARDADGRTISSASQPSMIALMLGQLDVRPGHRVLEIGTGSGYNAALLSRLVGAAGSVTTIDIDERLTAAATSALTAAGAQQVSVVTGDGWAGVPAAAPYDRIIMTVGVGDLSPAWIAQLSASGLLVVPLWLRPTVQLSVALGWHGADLVSRSAWPCGFVPLQGPHAGIQGLFTVHGGRTVLMDSPSPADVEAVRSLLAETPRRTTVSTVRRGWFTRLALKRPGALTLTRAGARSQRGLLLRPGGRAGLAVVAGDVLSSYGDPAAAGVLSGYLDRGSELELHRLLVTALPAGATGSTGADWVIRRPTYRFEIRA